MAGASVPIAGPLVEARFRARPNRFEVLAETAEGEARAHLADPGRLKELLVPEARLWLRAARSPRRKTEWSAVLVEAASGDLVSLDTLLANRLVRAALEAGALEELAGWRLDRAEHRHGTSRIDFLLAGGAGGEMLLEVKSLSLVVDGAGFFPDAVSARGARHLRELAAAARRQDTEAAVLFCAQHAGARSFAPARHIDPDFAGALAEASAAGVRVLARGCSLSLDRLTLGPPLPIHHA